MALSGVVDVGKDDEYIPWFGPCVMSSRRCVVLSEICCKKEQVTT